MQPAGGHGDGRQQGGEREDGRQFVAEDAQGRGGEQAKQAPPPEFRSRCAAVKAGVFREAGAYGIGELHGRPLGG